MAKKSVQLVLSLSGILLFFLSACKPAAAPLAPVPERKPQTEAVSGGKTGWEAEWEKTVQLARREGRVALYGPPLAETRRGFIEGFQKAFPGIALDFIAMTGSQVAPKISSERRAGIYMVDLHMGGTTTILSALREFAVPIKPWLVLPEVKDPASWRDGRMDFADEGETFNIVFTHNISPRIVYNSNTVTAAQLEGGSYWDLTKPEWKEKVLLTDPRIAGPGLALATLWYNTPELGVNFMRALAANKVLLMRDSRLMAEWVGHGRYSLLLAPSVDVVNDLQKAGMPLKWTQTMKEGNYVSNAFGSVIVMDKAPHPNAARVFLNWLLGKEGQTIYTRTSGYLSLRMDAPTDHLMPGLLPQQGAKYMPTYKEKYVMMKDEIVEELKRIFAGF